MEPATKHQYVIRDADGFYYGETSYNILYDAQQAVGALQTEYPEVTFTIYERTITITDKPVS